jgi:hypothetical protein
MWVQEFLSFGSYQGYPMHHENNFILDGVKKYTII